MDGGGLGTFSFWYLGLEKFKGWRWIFRITNHGGQRSDRWNAMSLHQVLMYFKRVPQLAVGLFLDSKEVGKRSRSVSPQRVGWQIGGQQKALLPLCRTQSTTPTVGVSHLVLQFKWEGTMWSTSVEIISLSLDYQTSYKCLFIHLHSQHHLSFLVQNSPLLPSPCLEIVMVDYKLPCHLLQVFLRCLSTYSYSIQVTEHGGPEINFRYTAERQRHMKFGEVVY